jgi:LDH2 family malate/lactate/ureidoglycolate dehydrogenase
VAVTGRARADVTLVNADRLRTFAQRVLRTTGLSDENAALVAEQIVWRDLREEHPIGLAALPSCVDAHVSGKANAAGTPTIARDTGVVAVVDGDGVWGQLTTAFAMRHAVTRARELGIGLALVRDSRTASTMGFYPTLAIAEGMIGFVITNSEPYQAPWGGTTKVLGNQAYALGAPAGGHHPLLFDGAATAISRARINSLALRGEALPEDVALDAEGRPTIDPIAALAGILLPSGGHKGYALSVFWEVLTSALADDAPEHADPKEGAGPGAVRTSLFVLAIDPRATVGLKRFTTSVDVLIDRLHASPPTQGVDRIYAPGERGYITAADRATTGIPFTASRIAELVALGAKVGVAW